MKTIDTFDPLTAYLAMAKGLINDADCEYTVRLTAQYASGYVQALYDIERIRPETLTLHREEIERMKNARLVAIATTDRIDPNEERAGLDD